MRIIYVSSLKGGLERGSSLFMIILMVSGGVKVGFDFLFLISIYYCFVGVEGGKFFRCGLLLNG